MGILVPAGTPADRIAALHKAVAAFSRQPDYQKQLQAQGVEAVASDPASFGKQIQAELQQWAEVVKAAGIKAG
jgi:tripartite-type tricarboxylate transporter receptor subunit TctC